MKKGAIPKISGLVMRVLTGGVGLAGAFPNYVDRIAFAV
jgi:hypothetical protein